MGIFENRNRLEEVAHETGYDIHGISDLMGLNHCQFCYLFQKEVGITPKAWLTETRIRKVINLLEQGVLPSDIWTELNYSNLAHMRNEIKNNTGLSPREIQLSSALNRVRFAKM